jgi:hypothetical protein
MDSAINREKIFSAQEQGLTTKNTGTQKSSTTNLQSPAPVPIMVPLAKFRPWLQDFNMGADYTADMVKQEIQATQDALGNDFSGFMLWNPSNIYTEEAILKPS